MLQLRADPWDPGYGMGFDAPEPDEGDTLADATVEEPGSWAPVRSASPPPEGCVVFVDGVRRIELRVVARDGDRRAQGLFGSYAIGCARVNGTATFGEHEVSRHVILGGGLSPEAATIPCGRNPVGYEPCSVDGADPDLPLRALQRLMREAEGRLAQGIARDAGCIVLADGRLTFFNPTAAPVVGVVKRFSKHYLPPENEAVLAVLAPAERTPLFVLAKPGDDVARYCWYTRLQPLRGPWHDHAGIVRCEVGAQVGLDVARALADRVTAMLPRFAGRATDPRAPQNLMPVGALEQRLRRHMGDERLIRRALTIWLMENA